MGILQLGTVLKFLFMGMGCLITAFVIYTTVTDGFPFRRRNILTPWMTATLIDLYINAIAIGAWICYKQSDWISAILWIVLLVGLRSIATCIYISIQFLKMSSKDCIKDPIYHILRRSKKKSGSYDLEVFNAGIGRIFFGVLGFLMLGTLIYTLITAGSPFHKHVLFPWLNVALVDFYINVVPLLVWIAYRECSFLRSVIWMVLLICFGSIGTCAYIVYHLFELDSSDPMYFVLFNYNDRLQVGYEKANDEKEEDSSITTVE